MEKGEAKHLMPMFDAKKKLREGKIKESDIPYMQRGNGKWDQTDVKGAKKKRWLGSDKDYAAGGYKKEQSVSVFGYGNGLDWTGKNAKKGPGAGEIAMLSTTKRGYTAPKLVNVDVAGDKPKKKGWFGR